MGNIEEKAMGFLELYAILALIAALGYFGIKYGLKAFEKYATVDFEASRYTPPSETFKVVGWSLHGALVVLILTIIFI